MGNIKMNNKYPYFGLVTQLILDHAAGIAKLLILAAL